jgi:alpha-L-fucosidase
MHVINTNAVLPRAPSPSGERPASTQWYPSIMSSSSSAPLNAVPTPYGPTPSPHQLAWHRREQYGFIHFTQNTFTGREWGLGDEDPATFNPTALDCRQWVAAAKAGGLKALILTAKHHDGFCLWPTATTSHSVAHSPFRGGKGDLVREFVAACRDGGIGAGLYCSPWDRNHAAYGTPEYVQVYHAQWRELLSNYGPLVELWFDGANGGEGYYGGAREKRTIDAFTYYRFDELWAECRRLQPEAVMFSDAGPDIRWCGNERGFNSVTSWCRIHPEGIAPGKVDDLSRLPLGEVDGVRWSPAEVDVSIRPGWFFHANERPRSVEELFHIWLASVGRNAGLNLNLTPDQRGLIPDEDVAVLHQFRHRVEAFTALDLAVGRTIEASSTAAGSPAALLDGSRETYWAAAAPTAEVTIDFGQQVRIGGIRLEEAIQFGQRVAAFQVQMRVFNVWLDVANGTTIGAQRILRLEQAVGDQLRVRILSSCANPILARLNVYAA